MSFALMNSLIDFTPSPAWIYAILAYVGHLSILACIPLLLLLFPVMMLIPQPRVILPIGVVLGSAGFSLLLLDGLVFAENRYHLSLLTLTMLAPRTWAFLGVYFLLGAAIETMLAVWVWRRTARPASRRIGWYLALGVGGCVAASHLIHAGAEARYYVPVTAFTRYLPLATTWRLYNASPIAGPMLIASGGEGKAATIRDTKTWRVAAQGYHDEQS